MKRDYEIQITADMDDDILWRVEKKGHPLTQLEGEDKDMVKSLIKDMQEILDEGRVPPDEVLIDKTLYEKLDNLGLIPNSVRSYNVGESDYSKHLIQPWSVWQEYNLNPWDADIVKRVLRTKQTDPRRLDYEKIIQICQERIRQLKKGSQNEK